MVIQTQWDYVFADTGVSRDFQSTAAVVAVCFAPRCPCKDTVPIDVTLSLSAVSTGFALPELPRPAIRLSTRNRKDSRVSSRRCPAL